MPDITMCANDDCPLSEGCYRNPFSGTNPNPLRQSWSRFTADEDGECDHFLAVKSRPQGASDGPQGQDGQHKTNTLPSRLPEQGR